LGGINTVRPRKKYPPEASTVPSWKKVALEVFDCKFISKPDQSSWAAKQDGHTWQQSADICDIHREQRLQFQWAIYFREQAFARKTRREMMGLQNDSI
jgi:hypothetical protein